MLHSDPSIGHPLLRDGLSAALSTPAADSAKQLSMTAVEWPVDFKSSSFLKLRFICLCISGSNLACVESCRTKPCAI